MFEKASRLKLRISTNKGVITVEDLWDLPLTSTRSNVLSLQTVARGIAATIRNEVEEDFVGDTTNENEIANLQMGIVKHVIAVKKVENAAKVAARANEAHNAQIDDLIAAKQFEAKKEMTVEELQALKK